ncbi:MAG: hypothetical protein LBL45_03925 [Treponema sp.]|jgi:hypothetical protein|nr:hypothetical protein [Treponema sp.]
MKRKLLVSGISGVMLVFAMMLFAGCGDGGGDNGGNSDTRREGVYIGIISFAGNVDDLTNGVPVFLDSAGKNSLISKLTSNYTRSESSGTALFYAIHKALANLTSRETQYPANLDSVNMISFTDGLDLTSSGLTAPSASRIEGKSFTSEPDYANYIADQIECRTIAGKPISAYSVGVAATEVLDSGGIERFEADLKKIASPGNDQRLTNFGSLQDTFREIAERLTVRNESTTFMMETTLLSNGYKVRMTFDAIDNDPTVSIKYIQGTISRERIGERDVYAFTNIKYVGGLGSLEDEGPISGEIETKANGVQVVKFNFTGVTGYTPTAEETNVKQWIMLPTATTWLPNPEYKSSGATNVQTDYRSSIIYLVLDSSASLSSSDIDQIRASSIQFINSLYDQLNNSSSGGNGGGGVSNITYSAVSGGAWTVQSDGSRKSPVIGDNGVTKARVSFTSGSSNTSITIRLRVSSERNCDFAFISELDNDYASYENGYYSGSLISGSTTETVTIPVSSSGRHFIDIGYEKDGSETDGSDCAWFTVIQ